VNSHKKDLGKPHRDLGSFIKYMFEHLDIAKVETIDFVPITKNGSPTSFTQAFVHISDWHNSASGQSIINRINDFEEGRISTPVHLVYDDPRYWILKPNKSMAPPQNHNVIIADLRKQVTALENQLRHVDLTSSNKRRRKMPTSSDD